MSRDNPYSIFFIDHIPLLLEVLYGEFKISANVRCVIQPKRKLAGVGYTSESGLLGVAYAEEAGLTSVGYTGKFGLPGLAYTGE